MKAIKECSPQTEQWAMEFIGLKFTLNHEYSRIIMIYDWDGTKGIMQCNQSIENESWLWSSNFQSIFGPNFPFPIN